MAPQDEPEDQSHHLFRRRGTPPPATQSAISHRRLSPQTIPRPGRRQTDQSSDGLAGDRSSFRLSTQRSNAKEPPHPVGSFVFPAAPSSSREVFKKSFANHCRSRSLACQEFWAL